MKEYNYDALSNGSRIPVRDIFFAQYTARTGTFDPFKDRSLSTLYGVQRHTSTALTFSERLQRRVPNPVCIARQVDPRKGGAADQYKHLGEIKYHPRLPSTVKTVSFTKGERPPLPGHEVADPKWVARRADKSFTPSFKTREELGRQVQEGSARPLSTEPRSRLGYAQAASFGRMSSREGRAPSGPRPASQASLRPHTADPEAPWMLEPHSVSDDESSGQNDVSTAVTKARAPPPDEEGADEEWQAKRRQFIARFGLTNTGKTDKRQRLRSVKGGAVDFASQVPRHAAMVCHAPPQRMNDVAYNPAFEKTSKVRAVAHVELGRQAKRFHDGPEHVRHVEKLLRVDFLSKYHQERLERERKATLGLPTAPSANAPIDVGSPLKASDEWSFHTDALKAPEKVVTRQLSGAPDIMASADRPNEPLDAVFGVQASAYRRAAQRDVDGLPPRRAPSSAQ